MLELNSADRQELLERFLRYVAIDTQSRPGSATYPSTDKQKDLLRLLVSELRELGLHDAAMDEHGYVMATLPSNLPPEQAGRIPVVGLLAHVDTYPETSGKDVKPQIIENYDGREIPLAGTPGVALTVEENPNLARVIGDTVITTDGTTLLGADDKAGLAEIMTALSWLKRNPDHPHGTLRVAFTPDEEIGAGTKHFDVARFGADLAYTLDGSDIGNIEDETFCADSAKVTVTGRDIHPGYGKNKLLNAVRIASELVTRVAEGPLPETTEGREGFLHPHIMSGNVGSATVDLLVRDFTVEGLEKLEARLKSLGEELEAKYDGAKLDIEISESYRNMKYPISKRPEVLTNALEAMRRAGIEPKQEAIRGGTDGSKLSEAGLPTPNIFAGGQNMHSVREWVALGWMAKAVVTVLHLVEIYAEG